MSDIANAIGINSMGIVRNLIFLNESFCTKSRMLDTLSNGIGRSIFDPFGGFSYATKLGEMFNPAQNSNDNQNNHTDGHDK